MSTTLAVKSGHRAKLARLAQYKHPAMVHRLQMKLGIRKDEAAKLFEETKQFLYLCSISKKPIAPTESLDAGWHEFLMFTKDYADFCQKHFGKFIHHRPRHPDDPPTGGEMSKRAREIAQQVLGDNLSESWKYPLLQGEASTPCDNCGCNAACNDDE